MGQTENKSLAILGTKLNCVFDNNNNNNIIVGNAFFAKGPKLGHLNGADVKTIKQEAWFTDQDTTLIGSVDFDDVIFKNDINVDVS